MSQQNQQTQGQVQGQAQSAPQGQMQHTAQSGAAATTPVVSLKDWASI